MNERTQRRPLRRSAWCVSLLLALVRGTPAQAEERISEETAVERAVQHNPDLRAALIDVARTEQLIEAADGLYVPVWQVDGGFTHAENPEVTPAGDYGVSESDTFDVGTEIRHTFPWGTQLQFRLEGLRSERTLQVTPGSSSRITIGPSWGLSGRFAAVQPLLRGAGTDTGESELRQARLGRTSAERARDSEASQLLRQVLVAYWELWYQERAAEIDREAETLAERQLREARQRVEAGAIAPVDTLSFETRAAELEQAVVQSEAAVRLRGLELMRLLGYEVLTGDVSASSVEPPDARSIPTAEEAIEEAMTESVELAELEAQIAQARDRVSTAGAATEPRLDLEAYVAASSLSTPDVPPALDRFVTEPALTAHVGLVFELPLSGGRRNAQVRAAELDVESVLARFSSLQGQVRAQVSTHVAQAQAAQQRLELARKTAEVADRQVTAQTERYENGVAIALEVHQAEDTRRRARLSVERARVDLAQALLELQHLTGDLLARYGRVLANAPVIRDGARHARLRHLRHVASPF